MKNVMLMLAMCFLVVVSANAAWMTVFSDGFENHPLGVMPTSAPSDIGDGWYDRWPNGSDVVVNTTVLSGEKSLELTRDYPGAGLYPARSFFDNGANQDFGIDVRVTLNMNRLNTNSATETYFRLGGVNVAGLGVGVDYLTQNYSYLDATGWTYDTGVAATVGGWDKVVTTFHLADFGGLIGGTFDMDITVEGGVPVNVVTGALMTPAAGDGWWDIYLNGKPQADGGIPNVVYYDDLLIEATPEPTTICLLAMGSLGLLRRKK
jgi:hypothetical protein